MKRFTAHSLVTVLLVSSLLSLAGPIPAFAATTPSLGAAATYGILSNHFQHNIAATTIIGNVGNSPTVGVLGYSDEAGVGAVVVSNGTTYVNNATWTAAGVAQGAALTDLNSQAPCVSLGAGAVNLDTVDIDAAGPLPPGTFTPGCYSSGGAMNITVNQTVTLSGVGTYIFKPTGALTTQANTHITLAGASACDVFWVPTGATTLGANSTFVGTDIDAAGITMGNLATWTGRALAYGGTVTADSNTVTVPTCTVAAPASGGSTGTINVVKTVINDNGGIGTVASFPLFVNGTPVVSGITNTFPAPANVYTVTEAAVPGYTRTFSGDCDANGGVNIIPGDNKFCIITNDDIGAAAVAPPIPPLIDVIKIPSPLALPNGPGLVTYSYILRNIGTVPVTDVTMVGDTCSPIVLVSGDTNADAKLDLDETWTYRCSMVLPATHTNTVVATGWANGLSAVDIASSTVIVGAPNVPPLIHVIKVPSPLTLGVGGGLVTYTERVTNPGTVSLSNVGLTDDKCAPLTYVSGDTNRDSLLDPSETWTYTCRTRLAGNTTNTAIASAQANGLALTVRDLAITTVLVAVPTLPVSGLPPGEIPWNIIVLGTVTLCLALLAIVLRNRITA